MWTHTTVSQFTRSGSVSPGADLGKRTPCFRYVVGQLMIPHNAASRTQNAITVARRAISGKFAGARPSRHSTLVRVSRYTGHRKTLLTRHRSTHCTLSGILRSCPLQTVVIVEDREVLMEVDKGASVTVISEARLGSIWGTQPSPPLQPTDVNCSHTWSRSPCGGWVGSQGAVPRPGGEPTTDCHCREWTQSACRLHRTVLGLCCGVHGLYYNYYLRSMPHSLNLYLAFDRDVFPIGYLARD